MQLKFVRAALVAREHPAVQRILLGTLGYLLPTFAIAFVWHLILFKRYYDALAMYRADVIIPFGFLSMIIQGTLFAWIYDIAFSRRNISWASRALGFGAFGAALSWSFTTIAVAAKNVMTSVPDYLLIETAFTCVQWIIVAPVVVWAHSIGGMSDDARA